MKNERKVRVGDRVKMVAKWAKSQGLPPASVGTVRAFKPVSFTFPPDHESDWVGVEWDGLEVGNNLDGILPKVGAGWWVAPEAITKVKARTPQTWKFVRESEKTAPAVDTERENNGLFIHAPFATIYVHIGYNGETQVTYWGRGKVRLSVDDRAQAEELRRF